MTARFRCGAAAIIGRSNVGKSTLLNALVEQKISITSSKQQTTQCQLRGIRTGADYQIVFVDTPGWQQRPRGGMNQAMNREVRHALDYVDVVLFTFDATTWRDEDDAILELLRHGATPLVGIANKIDLIKDKSRLLPLLEMVAGKASFQSILPISAKQSRYLDDVIAAIKVLLPERDLLYPEEQVTDQAERFMVAEIIREKVFRYLADELPYRTSVVVDRFAVGKDLTEIDATIRVARESQKGIVIGSGGAMIKRIGVSARSDIERLLQCRVNLRTWVKVGAPGPVTGDALESHGTE
ncbi:MAG: GTPase Era [Gammaproteobacteria bacterium]|nr:GTPase Era [Gammaproteobacteria bacterium]